MTAIPLLRGYRRPNDRWGVRNHVLVLPVRAAANRVAELLADGLTGAVAISHEWDVRPEDPDNELIRATLAGFASNPNVAAVLVVASRDTDAELADEIASRGGVVRVVTVADHGGTLACAAAGRPLLQQLVNEAAAQPRELMPISALSVGLECGGSDSLSGITANPALGIASDMLVEAGATPILAEIPELVGAEQLLAARAPDPAVARRMIHVVRDFEASVRQLGVDIRGAQPTPGNIQGGLTTIEEKSLGAAKKGGSAPLAGVLDFAQRPARAGLHVMDTPGHDIEQMVGLVAGGCQIIAFTTGRGTPTGSPIAPCLKIASNTRIFERMAGDIDLDAGRILSGDETLQSMGEAIYQALIAAADGRLTSSERRGNHEFALRRLGATVAA